MEFVASVGDLLIRLLLIMTMFLGLSAMCCVVIAIALKVKSIIGPGVLELTDPNSSEVLYGIGEDMNRTDMDTYIQLMDARRGVRKGGRSRD